MRYGLQQKNEKGEVRNKREIKLMCMCDGQIKEREGEGPWNEDTVANSLHFIVPNSFFTSPEIRNPHYQLLFHLSQRCLDVMCT